MLHRITDYCKDKFAACLRIYRQNKFIFALTAAAFVFGILLAVSGVSKFCERYSDGNIIMKFASNNFNVFSFYIKLLLFSISCYAIAVILSFNFIAFLCNFPIIMLLVRHFVRIAVASCILDGWTGWLLLILVYAPLIVFNIMLLGLFLGELYRLIGYNCGWKRIYPYRLYWKGIKRLLKTYLISVLIVNIVYSTLLIIILSIIF